MLVAAIANHGAPNQTDLFTMVGAFIVVGFVTWLFPNKAAA